MPGKCRKNIEQANEREKFGLNLQSRFLSETSRKKTARVFSFVLRFSQLRIHQK